jgi:hypothetical protein
MSIKGLIYKDQVVERACRYLPVALARMRSALSGRLGLERRFVLEVRRYRQHIRWPGKAQSGGLCNVAELRTGAIK